MKKFPWIVLVLQVLVFAGGWFLAAHHAAHKTHIATPPPLISPMAQILAGADRLAELGFSNVMVRGRSIIVQRGDALQVLMEAPKPGEVVDLDAILKMLVPMEKPKTAPVRIDPLL